MRKFSNKRFIFHCSSDKQGAEEIAAKLRKRGKLARVVKHTSKHVKGFYQVWIH